MARIDVPTLQCDRCTVVTQDTREMVAFQGLNHTHMSGTEKWDLCPLCWDRFIEFMEPPV